MASSPPPTRVVASTMLGHRMSSARRRRGSSIQQRHGDIEIPARLRGNTESESEGDGEDESTDKPFFAGQSVYGMLAAATSQSKFSGGFAPEPIEESESEDEGRKTHPISGKSSGQTARGDHVGTIPGKKPSERTFTGAGAFTRTQARDSDELRPDPMTQSQFLPSRQRKESVPERPASAGRMRAGTPVMDRKLQAMLKAEIESPSLSSSLHKGRDDGESVVKSTTPLTLPQALAQIFDFDEPEEVKAEYACWYLQSVLLQGYFYITQKHICYYAYLQKKGSTTIKSGNLSKRGKTNPRYRRYWFVLKGDVLSYYMKSNEPYFPRGTIDLRFAITAEVAPEKGQAHSEATAFNIVTDAITHHFRADSAVSAKEWVRQLQKVIFRSHNDGDSVKISIPISSIADVQLTTMVDFAPTIKVSVTAGLANLGVDEFYFTFLNSGKDALRMLQEVTENSPARAALETSPAADREGRGSSSKPKDSITASNRASPSPLHSHERHAKPAASPGQVGAATTSRRGSASKPTTSASRRSAPEGLSVRTNESRQRSDSSSSRHQPKPMGSPISSSMAASTESVATSADQRTDEEIQIDMSASQMLGGDRAFGAPTLRHPQPTRKEQAYSLAGSPNVQESSRAKFDHGSSTAKTERDTPSSSGRASFEIAGPIRFSSPFQHASNLAGYVRDTGKRMSSYLGTSPLTYYDKVTGAIAGGKRHYMEAGGLSAEDRIHDPDEDVDVVEHEKRFREHFALPATERLVATFFCSFQRLLPLYGKIYIGTTKLCFRSLLYGTRTKIVIPFKDIDNVTREQGMRIRYAGMVVVIRGHEEIFFDFRTTNLRDDCTTTILKKVQKMQRVEDSILLTDDERDKAEEAIAEKTLLNEASRKYEMPVTGSDPADPFHGTDTPQLLFDDPEGSVLDFMPREPMQITCLTIGSRGDVQPYIALCRELIADGHKAKIATHPEFEPWIRKYGIDFAAVGGNPAELMQLCVDKGMFTPSFLLETNNMRGWLENLLETAWEACQGSDLLIESPSAMCGIHIAEALGIPYFRAFTMPWTRTRAYPHAFANMSKKMGGQFNQTSYQLMEQVFWAVTAGQINRWRKRLLGLAPTSLVQMQQNKVPFLYNFSPSVVVPPLDFPDWIHITGYWFLDEGGSWAPPSDLSAFIKKARQDNMKLVYIGFGSVVVRDSRKMTQDIVNAVVKADVRCILSKGWSDRMDKVGNNEPEVPLPDCIFQIGAAPHDWLFRQIDAAVHHGGAGTTGASLRCGVPTIVKPFFGDQFFFASRIEDLGVGLSLDAITTNKLGRALWIATRDDRMRNNARLLGERIRAETGVQNAVNAIYRDLEYAKSLIKKQSAGNAKAALGSKAGGHMAARGVAPHGPDHHHHHTHHDDGHDDDDDDEQEESWTFIEPDSGVEDLSKDRQDANYWASSIRRSALQARLASKALTG